MHEKARERARLGEGHDEGAWYRSIQVGPAQPFPYCFPSFLLMTAENFWGASTSQIKQHSHGLWSIREVRRYSAVRPSNGCR